MRRAGPLKIAMKQGLCVALVFGVVGCEPGQEFEALPWSPPDEAGLFEVGLRTLYINDPRGKELVVDVWYPAEVTDSDVVAQYSPTNLEREAFRDPLPSRSYGPRPIVAFSHGYLGIRFQSYFLAEHLASHGYVVVAPDHQFNTLLDGDSSQDVRMMLERPDDLRFSVDHLLEEGREPGRFEGLYQEDAYGVIGHSFGTITAMRLGGGEVDWPGMTAVCEQGQGKGQVCGALAEIEALDDGSYGGVDPRVVSTVPMSPGFWYAFGEGGKGLDSVNSPFVLVGGRDDVLSWQGEAQPAYDAMSAPKRLAFFETAGHYGFTVLCDVLPGFKEECKGPDAGFEDSELVHELTNAWVTAHLGETLLGEARYAEWLAPSVADDWPTVSLSETR